MPCIGMNSRKMVPEPIGRFFPDPITSPCDSKIKKEKSMRVEILMSNTENQKLKIFNVGFFRFAAPEISIHGEFPDFLIRFWRNTESMHLGIRPNKSDLKSKIRNLNCFLRFAVLSYFGGPL